jgi:hypothetical protein
MSRSRYTDPMENLRSYVMVHGGIDREERLVDVEWVEDVIKAAKEVGRSVTSDEYDASIKRLKEALRA